MLRNNFINFFILIGTIILVWLILHLYSRFVNHSQSSPPPTVKRQITRAILRVLFFIWFNLCGAAAVFGLFLLMAIAKINSGGDGFSPPFSISQNEKIGFGLIAMPIAIGMLASFAAYSRKSVVLWACVAYGLYVAGLLFLTGFDISFHNIRQELSVSSMLTTYFIPVHLGWIGLPFIFRTTLPTSLPPLPSP